MFQFKHWVPAFSEPRSKGSISDTRWRILPYKVLAIHEYVFGIADHSLWMLEKYYQPFSLASDENEDNSDKNFPAMSFLLLCWIGRYQQWPMFRFNIYTLHQRGITLRKKSESSYLVNLLTTPKVENSFEKNNRWTDLVNQRLKIVLHGFTGEQSR